MCRRVECPRCGRPTFAGCGAHIEQVLGDVPRNHRCRCNEPSARSPAAEHVGTSPTASASKAGRRLGR